MRDGIVHTGKRLLSIHKVAEVLISTQRIGKVLFQCCLVTCVQIFRIPGHRRIICSGNKFCDTISIISRFDIPRANAGQRFRNITCRLRCHGLVRQITDAEDRAAHHCRCQHHSSDSLYQFRMHIHSNASNA